MLKKEKEERELTIDWRHLSLSLLRKAWLIVISGILLGMFSIFYNSFFVAPKYSSSVLLYVNNKSLSLGQIDVSMSASDLSASQSLIDTYIVILNSRETLEEVAELAGVEYSYEEIKGMVTTAKKEGTEIFEVIVTTEDPYEAQHIAACISEILPDRIEEIIDGSSMRIVDEAVVNTSKVAPSITRSAIKAFAIGVLIMILAVSVWAIVDDTIRTDDYITSNYDLPVLAVIPDFESKGSGSYYKNYYYYRGYGKSPEYDNSERQA
jgi:capsular polysaccharide biosynthesis protein